MDVFSVSQINGYIKSLFEGDMLLDDVTIIGEISNFKCHSSGHWYFSLKDEASAISAAMFRGANRTMRFFPESGMRVAAHGRVTVYPPSGSYQIIVDSMLPDGVGALYAAFEKLKEKLSKEGLFDAERKKPLPTYPKKIGVVTSPTGAAIGDIISVTGRRWKYAEIVLAPVLVQGAEAPQSIISAIKEMNRKKACDVMIVGRGGGSIEDLWCFNDEGVARAVAASDIPVISAVGHETDFTICDFVADVRAATPSAAAELAVPDANMLIEQFDSWSERELRLLSGRIENYSVRLNDIMNMPAMKNPRTAVDICAQRFDSVMEKLNTAFSTVIADRKERLASAAAKLDALNPMGVLSRGYSAVYKNGRIVSRIDELSIDEEIDIRLSNGSVKGRITEISEI